MSRNTTSAADVPGWVLEWAPCLKEGALAAPGRAAVRAAAALGRSREASILRAWSVYRVFTWCEECYRADGPPIPRFASHLDALAEWFAAGAELSLPADGTGSSGSEAADVPAFTGSHYGELFRAFDPVSFFEEPSEVLRQRLERNGIPLDRFHGARVLDAGCGGGRYSVALARLGASDVVGLDFSETGVADARKRVAEAGIPNVRFEVGSVLDLPYPDAAFDVVFSNGVIHHTSDWRRGLAELLRVLKPGGLGWLYVIEDPGGLHWDSIEILRVIMQGESPEMARATLRHLGVPVNRVFYMLDHVMVPINVRLRAERVEEALRAAAAVGIRRLTRGCSYDRIEQLYQQIPFAADKWGVGEHRYVFSK